MLIANEEITETARRYLSSWRCPFIAPFQHAGETQAEPAYPTSEILLVRPYLDGGSSSMSRRLCI